MQFCFWFDIFLEAAFFLHSKVTHYSFLKERKLKISPVVFFWQCFFEKNNYTTHCWGHSLSSGKRISNAWYQEVSFFLEEHPCSIKQRPDFLFSVAGESQSCHKGQCRRRRVVSCWQRAEHQIQDSQVNFIYLYKWKNCFPAHHSLYWGFCKIENFDVKV